jgi:hypothetical protein
MFIRVTLGPAAGASPTPGIDNRPLAGKSTDTRFDARQR